MEDETIEYVEAEIVSPDEFIGRSVGIKDIPIEAVPKKAFRAPAPNKMFMPPRPDKRRYKTADELQAAIDEYFSGLMRSAYNEQTHETEYYWIDTPSWPGLALSLGLTTQTLRNYEKQDDLALVIDKARDVIQDYNVKAAERGSVGAIFVLKNMGWSDNKVVTFAPPSRLAAAKTPEQLAELIEQDVVD